MCRIPQAPIGSVVRTFPGEPAVLLAAVLLALCAAPAARASTAERAALVELHQATDGARWRNGTNWLSAAPLSEWAGVTTDADGRVTRLELPSNGLNGTLPGSLGDLTLLEVLDLSRNRLSGALPATLGNLSKLERLDLHRSRALTGPLPDGLRLLPALTTLSALRTELCAPRDADFQAWLAGISSSVLTCPPETQSVIDLAVFYTPFILRRHNNRDGTLSEEAMTRRLLAGLDLHIEELNRAMRESGVNARAAVVYAGKLEKESSFSRNTDFDLGGGVSVRVIQSTPSMSSIEPISSACLGPTTATGTRSTGCATSTRPTSSG